MKIRKATIKDVGAIDVLNKEFFHEEVRDWKAAFGSVGLMTAITQIKAGR